MHSAEARGSLSTGGNATSDTFLSTRAYMKIHRPKFTIMENVSDIDEGGSGESLLETNQSNLSQLRDLLSEIGYVTFVLLLNSKDFFVPQDRWRIYIGGVPLEVYGYDLPSATRSVASMAELIESLQSEQQIDLEQFLIADNDELVMHELRHVQEASEEDDPWSKETGWQKAHREKFEEHGLRWGYETVPHEMQASPWFQTLKPREQDLILFTMKTQPAAVSLDLSQSIGRHRVSLANKCPGTVTPSEKRFFLKRRRLRVAVESLAMQAIPWQDIDVSHEPHVLHSLAGNAWTGTVAMAVLFSILMQIPAWSHDSYDAD